MSAKSETRLTKLVRQALSHTAPLGAYRIAQLLTEQTGHRNYANTVYRIIAPMVASGEVVALASVKGWVLARSGQSKGMILICDQCHDVEQMPTNSVNSAIDRLCKERHFSPDCTHIEMIGQCASCGS